VLLVLGLLAGNALSGGDDTVTVAGETTSSVPPALGPPAATTQAPVGPPTGGAKASATPSATASSTASLSASTSAPTASASASPSASSAQPTASAAPSASATKAPTASATPSSTPKPTPSPSGSSGTNSDPSSDSGVGKAPKPRSGSDISLGAGSTSIDLKTWQSRMVERGWDLTSDGVFGARTRHVVESFQAEKGLRVDGILGPETWNAAWTTRVT